MSSKKLVDMLTGHEECKRQTFENVMMRCVDGMNNGVQCNGDWIKVVMTENACKNAELTEWMWWLSAMFAVFVFMYFIKWIIYETLKSCFNRCIVSMQNERPSKQRLWYYKWFRPYQSYKYWRDKAKLKKKLDECMEKMKKMQEEKTLIQNV